MDSKRKPLKKSDMGIAGALIVLSQVLQGSLSTGSISKDISDLRESINVVRLEQEKYFVKKEDLKTVVTKLDSMNSKLSRIKDQIKIIGDDHITTSAIDHRLFEPNYHLSQNLWRKKLSHAYDSR